MRRIVFPACKSQSELEGQLIGSFKSKLTYLSHFLISLYANKERNKKFIISGLLQWMNIDNRLMSLKMEKVNSYFHHVMNKRMLMTVW